MTVNVSLIMQFFFIIGRLDGSSCHVQELSFLEQCFDVLEQCFYVMQESGQIMNFRNVFH